MTYTMSLDFTNEQLYFILQPIWDLMDYKFKYQINYLVVANDGDSYVQSIDLNFSILYQFYETLINSPINYLVDGILSDIYPQLYAGSNFASPQVDDLNDYAQGYNLFTGVTSGYSTPLSDRISDGKNKIIA